jgi:hypothetical protein
MVYFPIRNITTCILFLQGGCSWNLWFNVLFELILKLLMALYASCTRITSKFVLLFYPISLTQFSENVISFCALSLLNPPVHFFSQNSSISCLPFVFISCRITFTILRSKSDYKALYLNEFHYSSPFTICQTCHFRFRSCRVPCGLYVRISNENILLQFQRRSLDSHNRSCFLELVVMTARILLSSVLSTS